MGAVQALMTRVLSHGSGAKVAGDETSNVTGKKPPYKEVISVQPTPVATPRTPADHDEEGASDDEAE